MEGNQTPLWMPEGSIRGALALGTVGATLVAVIMLPELKSQAVTALVGFGNLVLGFYFGSRKK